MVVTEAIRLTRSASRRFTVLTYALIYSEVLDIALNAERGKTFHAFSTFQKALMKEPAIRVKENILFTVHFYFKTQTHFTFHMPRSNCK